jgi:hypothetical protein
MQSDVIGRLQSRVGKGTAKARVRKGAEAG